jgi:hypothetical protein
MKVKISPENLWPKIATSEIKHRCLTEFKESMSNDVVHQRICAIRVCLHYKREGFEINIAKISNKELIHSADQIPSCIIRLNVDIDSNTNNLQISDYLF